MNRLRIALAAAALCVVTGCSGGAFDVKGTVGLISADPSDVVSAGGTCEGAGGYSDLAQGADVVVRDSKGTKIGVGELDQGTEPKEGGGCDFTFTVDNVSGGEGDVYSIEVSHRGEVSFKKSDADSLVMSIGG